MSLEIVDALIKSLKEADSSDLSQEGKNAGNAEEETLSFVRTSLGYLGYRSFSNAGIVGAYNSFSEDKTKKINDKANKEIEKVNKRIDEENEEINRENKKINEENRDIIVRRIYGIRGMMRHDVDLSMLNHDEVKEEINKKNINIVKLNQEIESSNCSDRMYHVDRDLDSNAPGHHPIPKLKRMQPIKDRLPITDTPVFHEMKAPQLRCLSDLDGSKLVYLLSELGRPYLHRNAKKLADVVLELVPDDGNPASYARKVCEYFKVVEPVNDILRGLDQMNGLEVRGATISFINRSLEALGYQSGVDGINERISESRNAFNKMRIKNEIELPSPPNVRRKIMNETEKEQQQQQASGLGEALAGVFAWCNRKINGSDAECDGSSTPYYAMKFFQLEPFEFGDLHDLNPANIRSLINDMLDKKVDDFIDGNYILAAMLGDAILENREIEGAPVAPAEKLSSLDVGKFERDPFAKNTFEYSGVPFV